MKVLCLGDAHFMLSNLEQTEIYMKELETFLSTNKFDLIVNLGDTLDSFSRLSTPCLIRATKYIRLLANHALTYVIVGNHDAVNNSIFLSDNHWLEVLKYTNNVIIVDTVVKLDNLLFCPYVKDGRFIEALKTFPEDFCNFKVIFSHVSVKGVDMNGIIVKDADVWEDNYPLLISGHIHLSQWINKNCYYTGSILQVAVNENPDKHIVVLDTETLEIKEVILNLPKKQILYFDLHEIKSENIIPEDKNTKYTIRIKCTVEEANTFRKGTLFKNLQKKATVQFESPKTVTVKKENLNTDFKEIILSLIKDDKDLLSFYNELEF